MGKFDLDPATILLISFIILVGILAVIIMNLAFIAL